MDYNALIAKLKDLTNVTLTQSSIAKVLQIPQSTIGNRISRGTHFKLEELFKLEKAYGLPIGVLSGVQTGSTDCIEIPYYDVKGSCGTGVMVYEPEIRSIKLDSTLIAKVLKRKPENLHIIEAVGDSMEGDGIYEGDILLIDSSNTNPMVQGIYVFTTQNNELVYIKRLYLHPDGLLDVISANPRYQTLRYSNKDIEKLNLSVKGRVIKNLSRGL